ncbi:hypothetical protein EIN_039030 [Entamoeba invadens IP1]|uniref:Tyrosine-protein kinase ephrin type A/B receptor-like domain-containing protein n=1 Tax=Entamoeba invadens IP1 TaxID=370355 RepID=L7FQN5_ENTIV|nr:hypothetical protein EIN_039030 [Entamoeba invadens IP1]ELP94683.1 hypothetical protein EIN_039030 [Entamoeba invadens IP1]|eukprot:XP_004261454.1 hypothetical protein EIN_039030 [Entamoeba invadens IP1]
MYNVLFNIFVLLITSTNSAVFTWSSGSGYFDSSTHWSPQGIPDSGDTAVICPTTASEIILRTSTQSTILFGGETCSESVLKITSNDVTINSLQVLMKGSVLLSSNTLNTSLLAINGKFESEIATLINTNSLEVKQNGVVNGKMNLNVTSTTLITGSVNITTLTTNSLTLNSITMNAKSVTSNNINGIGVINGKVYLDGEVTLSNTIEVKGEVEMNNVNLKNFFSKVSGLIAIDSSITSPQSSVISGGDIYLESSTLELFSLENIQNFDVIGISKLVTVKGSSNTQIRIARTAELLIDKGQGEFNTQSGKVCIKEGAVNGVFNSELTIEKNVTLNGNVIGNVECVNGGEFLKSNVVFNEIKEFTCKATISILTFKQDVEILNGKITNCSLIVEKSANYIHNSESTFVTIHNNIFTIEDVKSNLYYDGVALVVKQNVVASKLEQKSGVLIVKGNENNLMAFDVGEISIQNANFTNVKMEKTKNIFVETGFDVLCENCVVDGTQFDGSPNRLEGRNSLFKNCKINSEIHFIDSIVEGSTCKNVFSEATNNFTNSKFSKITVNESSELLFIDSFVIVQMVNNGKVINRSPTVALINNLNGLFVSEIDECYIQFTNYGTMNFIEKTQNIILNAISFNYGIISGFGKFTIEAYQFTNGGYLKSGTKFIDSAVTIYKNSTFEDQTITFERCSFTFPNGSPLFNEVILTVSAESQTPLLATGLQLKKLQNRNKVFKFLTNDLEISDSTLNEQKLELEGIPVVIQNSVIPTISLTNCTVSLSATVFTTLETNYCDISDDISTQLLKSQNSNFQKVESKTLEVSNVTIAYLEVSESTSLHNVAPDTVSAPLYSILSGINLQSALTVNGFFHFKNLNLESNEAHKVELVSNVVPFIIEDTTIISVTLPSVITRGNVVLTDITANSVINIGNLSISSKEKTMIESLRLLANSSLVSQKQFEISHFYVGVNVQTDIQELTISKELSFDGDLHFSTVVLLENCVITCPKTSKIYTETIVSFKSNVFKIPVFVKKHCAELNISGSGVLVTEESFKGSCIDSHIEYMQNYGEYVGGDGLQMVENYGMFVLQDETFQRAIDNHGILQMNNGRIDSESRVHLFPYSIVRGNGYIREMDVQTEDTRKSMKTDIELNYDNLVNHLEGYSLERTTQNYNNGGDETLDIKSTIKEEALPILDIDGQLRVSLCLSNMLIVKIKIFEDLNDLLIFDEFYDYMMNFDITITDFAIYDAKNYTVFEFGRGDFVPRLSVDFVNIENYLETPWRYGQTDNSLYVEFNGCEFVYNTETKKCKECEAGEIFNNVTHLCDGCELGMIYTTAGICIPCPEGTYSSNNLCVKCPADEVSPVQSSFCTKCEDGSLPNENNSKCEYCPVGTRLEKNSEFTKCLPCSAGTYRDENLITMNDCTECPIGTYSSHNGAFECSKCPLGFYSDAVGSKTCKKCEDGYYTINTGSVTCERCEDGHYSSPNGGECLTCPSGFERGEFGCIWCKAGFYKGGDGIKCVECPEGFYQEKQGMAYCNECDGKKQVNLNKTKCENRPSEPDTVAMTITYSLFPLIVALCCGLGCGAAWMDDRKERKKKKMMAIAEVQKEEEHKLIESEEHEEEQNIQEEKKNEEIKKKMEEKNVNMNEKENGITKEEIEMEEIEQEESFDIEDIEQMIESIKNKPQKNEEDRKEEDVKESSQNDMQNINNELKEQVH